MPTFKDFGNQVRFTMTKKSVVNEIFNDSKYFKDNNLQKENIWKAYKNKDEVDKDLIKKYFKFDQNQMNILLDEAKKQQLNSEVKDTLKEMGETNSKEVDKVTEKVQEDEKKDPTKNNIDKKKELKGKIIEAAAYNRAKGYQKEVLRQKSRQIEGKDLGLKEDDALKDMREEQVYVRMYSKYKKYTGKNLSDNKSIKNLQKKFTIREENLQKGAENRENQAMRDALDLRRRKAEKFEAYIEAIEKNDPKVAQYKKEYEDACYDLVQNDPKGKENKYEEQLKLQEKLEQKAKQKGVSKISAVNRTIDYRNEREDKISESKLVESFEKDQRKNNKKEDIVQDKLDSNAQKLDKNEQYDELEILRAEEKKNAEVESNVKGTKVNGVQYKDNYHDTRKTIQRNDEEYKEEKKENINEFMSELRSNVRDPHESAKDILKENDRVVQNYQKNTRNEARKDNIDAQRTMRKNKKYGNPNNN